MGGRETGAIATGWSVALGLGIAAGGAARADVPRWILGVSPVVTFDSGSYFNDQAIGPLRDKKETSVTNRRPLGVDVYALYHVQTGDSLEPSGGLRVGGEFRYLGTAADKAGKDRYELGTLMELGARAEWDFALTDKFALSAGARAALAILAPTGDFAEDVDQLAEQGVPTSDGPRVGVSLIGLLGARWIVHEHVAVHVEAGLGWSYLSLIAVDDAVQGVAFQRTLSRSVTRFEASLGIEFLF